MGRYCIATMDSRNGWENTSPTNALALHVTYWFVSRENQDKVLGKVPGFYALFQKHGQNPEEFRKQVEEQFKLYLEEQFDEVAVVVTLQNITGQANNYTMILASRVAVDGVKYDLAETILITGELYKVVSNARLNR